MRSLLFVFTIIAALIITYTIIDYVNYSSNRLEEGISKGNITADNVKTHLDSISNLTKESIQYLEKKIGNEVLSENELGLIIKNEVIKLDFLLGITIAYEPYVFNKDKKMFSLFYQRKTNEITHVEDEYNYLDSSLVTSQWYTVAAKTKKAFLSSPYIAQAAKELIIDYSQPIFRLDEKGNSIFIGVITYSISPDKFTEVVNNFVKGNSGYVYLSDSLGNIITHPNRSYILKLNTLDFDYGREHDQLVNKIKNASSGHVNYISPYTGVSSILFFQTAAYTNWRISIVYSRTDLMGNPEILKQKILHIVLAGSILILFIVAIFLRAHQAKSRQLWQMAIISSILFLLNIVAVWVLQLDIDYSEELKNRTRIYSDNALHSYVTRKNYEQKLLGKNEFLEIPTGILIEELLVSDSYNMSVSGKLWQKWPINNDLKYKEGFHFLQASPEGRSVIVELQSKQKIDSANWLYTWKFNATLRIFFDYNQYPLDQHYIDIKIVYPDLAAEVMLVPDFESYEVLNPSAKPGLSDIIFLPRHRIIASYFSFSSLDMKTFFGRDRNLTTSEYEALEYNIVIKRRFITPFVSFIIPFILGASIIYFLLFSLTNNKENNSGVTVMGVVQGMSALFFTMLLAHITIRNRIPTPHITYLETFYFVAYFLIVLLILIVVIYSNSKKYKFITYGDNLIIKVLYWPFLMGTLYIITLIKFY